jgi:hypothetical protein
VRKISMKYYAEVLIKYANSFKGNITPSTSGVAYTYKDLAFCRVEEDLKIQGIWIHGLFSIEKGYGARLVKSILKEHKNVMIRLNCYKELENYYKQFGFKKYFEFGNYCEMMKMN